MDFLFISGSSIPTKCGVGKFAHKIIELLISENYTCCLIANENQKLSTNSPIKKNYEILKIDLSLKNLLKILRKIRQIQPRVINIQYNSLDLSRSPFTIFLAILIKLFFRKIRLQVMLHEFSSYTILGKIKYSLSTLVANKVFFSDKCQMNSAVNFTFGLIKNKSSILPLGSNINYVKTDYEPYFAKSGDELRIAFHGLIQPKNGIEYLLQSLLKLKRKGTKVHLDILGDFKLLMDYGNLQDEIKVYQNKWLSFLNQNLVDNVTIHGDLEPESENFRNILAKNEVTIIPDINGLTIRRSSFWNVFMQSNNIMFASYDPKYSDDIFSNFITFDPKNANSISEAISKYLHSPLIDKKIQLQKQEKVREVMSHQNLKKLQLNELLS
jgi:glycosyltransferase involved in cell wall biosynthesis